jgi:hypothetical protein
MYRYAAICYRIPPRCAAFGLQYGSAGRHGHNWKHNITVLKKPGSYSGFHSAAPLALHPRTITLQESNMKTKTTRLAFALLTTLSALGATAALAPAAQAQVVGVDVRIGTPPPAPRYEVVPAPRHGYAWAPGYWAWNGHRHIWIGGHWERVRRDYARYEPAHWQPGPGGWVFIPGHWVR